MGFQCNIALKIGIQLQFQFHRPTLWKRFPVLTHISINRCVQTQPKNLFFSSDLSVADVFSLYVYYYVLLYYLLPVYIYYLLCIFVKRNDHIFFGIALYKTRILLCLIPSQMYHQSINLRNYEVILTLLEFIRSCIQRK